MAVPAVLCLALGIGVNALVFELVDGLLFRAPPLVNDAAQVTRAYLKSPAAGTGPVASSLFSIPDYVAISGSRDGFVHSAAYARGEVEVGSGVDATPARVTWVTAEYFRTLGVDPFMGRFFTETEARLAPVDPTVVVLSYGYWRQRFEGSQSVVGKAVTIDGMPYTIIGVTPQAFRGAELAGTDLWAPLPGAGHALSAMLGNEWMESRSNRLVEIIGRLQVGVSRDQAAQRLDLIVRSAAGQSAEPRAAASETVVLAPLARGRGPVAPQEARVGMWAAAVAFLVFCIACANVASLAIVRFHHLAPQLALRRALGATRIALSRSAVLESGMLAVAGGAGAFLVALWLTPVVGALFGGSDLPPNAFAPDGRLIAVALGLITISIVLVAGLPLWEIWRQDLSPALLSNVSARVTIRSNAVRALVVGQVALTLMLLVGAGLLMRSLRNLRAIDVGFSSNGLLVATTDLTRAGYTFSESDARLREAVATIEALPGIQSVSLAITAPFGSSIGTSVRVPERDLGPVTGAMAPRYNAVSAHYFVTSGTHIIAGRGFTESDGEKGARVAIVSQAMAHLMWPDASAIGKCLKLGRPDAPCTEIVGVAGDTRSRDLRGPYDVQVYVPFAQNELTVANRVMLIRLSASGNASMDREVSRALQANGIPSGMVRLRMMDSLLDPEVRPWRLGAFAFAAFGTLALALAGVGLYGVLSYIVSRRTREIGVRIALGATPSSIVRMIVSEGARLALAGVSVGIVGALLAGRAMGALLYQVSSFDPVTLVAGTLVLLTVATMACLVPALRATRVDPNAALRVEQ